MVQATLTLRRSLLQSCRAPGALFDRFRGETEEKSELEVRVAFGRTVGFHGYFRPTPATAAEALGRGLFAVVSWFIWDRSRRSAPSVVAGGTV